MSTVRIVLQEYVPREFGAGVFPVNADVLRAEEVRRDRERHAVDDTSSAADDLLQRLQLDALQTRRNLRTQTTLHRRHERTRFASFACRSSDLASTGQRGKLFRSLVTTEPGKRRVFPLNFSGRTY